MKKNLFNSLNKNTRTIMQGIDTKNMEFTSLASYVGKVVAVKGFFFTEGNYGKQVVVVARDNLINMPARATEEFEEIAKNEEMLSAVLNGELLLTDISPVSAKAGDTYSYTFEQA